jgi:hypothetical protein
MKNRNQTAETTSVCCVCGCHLGGPWPATGSLSHGYCRFHFQAALENVQRFHAMLDQSKAVSSQVRAA